MGKPVRERAGRRSGGEKRDRRKAAAQKQDAAARCMTASRGSSSSSGAAAAAACAHVTKATAKGAKAHRKRLTVDHCQSCDAPSAWLCLTCGNVGCGRDDAGHAEEHFKSNGIKHCISFCAMQARFWCYACDDEVDIDPEAMFAKTWRRQALDKLTKTLTLKSARERNSNDDDDAVKKYANEMANSGDVSGPRGIKNIGNTCFFASLMQSVCVARPLRAYFNKKSSADDRPLHAGLRAFSSLLLSSGSAANPGALLDLVSQRHRIFRGRQQHDAHELLRCLVAALHEEYLDDVVAMRKAAVRSWDVDDMRRFLREAMPALPNDVVDDLAPLLVDSKYDDDLVPEQHRDAFASLHRALRHGRSPFIRVTLPSLVDDTFGGMLQSHIRCLACQHVSNTLEPCYDLSLSITPSVALASPRHHQRKTPKKASTVPEDEDVLVAVTIDLLVDAVVNLSISAVEVHESTVRQQYKASQAQLRGPCTVSDCLRAFFSAEILTGDNAYDCSKCKRRSASSKLYTVERTPAVLVLHLKRFSQDGRRLHKEDKHIGFDIDLDLRPYSSSSSASYSLFAVVVHMGSMGGGHYVAYVKRHGDQWMYFSDATVAPVSVERVLSQQAYLLLYERTG
ncbi:hypothetical protein PBRA_000628 [Plasmodiophora brassicae]|nr:hypothetical protein PBRA_000628 [Plasmodiophora brassicae]